MLVFAEMVAVVSCCGLVFFLLGNGPLRDLGERFLDILCGGGGGLEMPF